MAEKTYYLVNPSGTIHEVTREHARARLRQVGYRMATKEEITTFKALRAKAGKENRRFTQVHDDPIAQPWSPEPEPEPDVEAE